jgi:hypothetical protein
VSAESRKKSLFFISHLFWFSSGYPVGVSGFCGAGKASAPTPPRQPSGMFGVGNPVGVPRPRLHLRKGAHMKYCSHSFNISMAKLNVKYPNPSQATVIIMELRMTHGRKLRKCRINGFTTGGPVVEYGCSFKGRNGII